MSFDNENDETKIDFEQKNNNSSSGNSGDKLSVKKANKNNGKLSSRNMK